MHKRIIDFTESQRNFPSLLAAEKANNLTSLIYLRIHSSCLQRETQREKERILNLVEKIKSFPLSFIHYLLLAPEQIFMLPQDLMQNDEETERGCERRKK